MRSTSYHEPSYKRVLQLLFKMPAVFKIDELALTAAAIGRPGLREVVPELRNFEVYGNYAEIVRRADRRHLTSKAEITNWQDSSDYVIYAVQDVLRKPLDLRKDDLPAASPGLGGRQVRRVFAGNYSLPLRNESAAANRATSYCRTSQSSTFPRRRTHMPRVAPHTEE